MASKPRKAECILLRKVGLTPKYDHTYRFDDIMEQERFFLEKYWYQYPNMSYIRTSYNTVTLMVQIRSPQDNINTGESETKRAQILYEVDYLMYTEHRNDKSQSHGGKGRWFYCFVTDIEYVNEGCYRIFAQIDFIQTYMIDYWNGMKQAFIIRQHSQHDNLYENVVPENIEIGDEYQFEWLEWNNMNKVPEVLDDEDGTFTGWVPVVALPAKQFDETRTGVNRYSRIPTGLQYIAFDRMYGIDLSPENKTFSPMGFGTWIDNIDGKTEQNIITMFMYPKDLVPTKQQGDMKAYTETVKLAGMGYNPWDSIGYTPRNKKMYTYPYCFIEVVNGCGQAQEYKGEWVTERGVDTLYFDIYGTFGASPEFICRPRNYCSADRLPFDCVTLSGVPQIGWSADNYKIYLAQNESSLKTNAVLNKFAVAESVMNAVRGAGTAIGGSVMASNSVTDSEYQQGMDMGSSGTGQIKSAISGLSAVMQYNAKQQDMKNIARTSHLAQAPTPQYALGRMGFMGYYARLAGTWVQRVDNFWDMFGYPVNNIGKPNPFRRKGWVYIQCVNVANTGDCPTVAKTEYSNVLAKGITFWNPNYVMGDYSQDNAPD